MTTVIVWGNKALDLAGWRPRYSRPIQTRQDSYIEQQVAQTSFLVSAQSARAQQQRAASQSGATGFASPVEIQGRAVPGKSRGETRGHAVPNKSRGESPLGHSVTNKSRGETPVVRIPTIPQSSR